MKQRIVESGITFDIEQDHLYYIEQSKLVQNTKYFKTPEFVCLRGDDVVVLEAKSTVPSPMSKADFKTYLDEIRLKFFNSMALLNACWSKCNPVELQTMPATLQQQKMHQAQFQLYLVIANAKKEWLVDVNNAFKSELQILFKIWNIPDTAFRAITKEKAIQLGLAVE